MTQPLALPSHSHEVRIDELGELIAALPGLLGFHPVDSLVLTTFTAAGGNRLGPTVRVDLPPAGQRLDLVTQLVRALEQNEVVAVGAVIVGGGTADPPDLPHGGLVGTLAMILRGLGIRIVHTAWVPRIAKDQTWWCYEEAGCTGSVRDPDTSTLAVIQTVAGAVIYASREEMAGLLAPDHEDRVAHRAQLLAATGSADPVELATDLMNALDVAAARESLPDLEDEQLTRCAAALGHRSVRDICLSLMLTDRAEAAERLWTVLTRAVPAPERAEPAFLLALGAYLRGAAVLAGIALEVALEADPDHESARLLRNALDHATPPAEVRRLLTRSVEHTRSRRRHPANTPRRHP